jgi:hypothetical protein
MPVPAPDSSAATLVTRPAIATSRGQLRSVPPPRPGNFDDLTTCAIEPKGATDTARPLRPIARFLAARLPKLEVMKLNKLVVSSYKLMGFAILATILVGLGSFIFINIFYLLSSSWVTPMIISSTDPRVLQLNAQYAADKAARDGVAAQRLQLLANLEDVKRIEESEGRFQRTFEDVTMLEAADNDAQLQKLVQLHGAVRSTRGELGLTSRAYTKVSKEGLQQELAAGLIDKDQATRGGYELSQIAGANLALHERDVEIARSIAELTRTVASLKGGKALSFDVLHVQHEYEQSKLASQKAAGDREAIGKSIVMLDGVIASYDTQLARIEKAPYVEAADKNVSTAFVPYDNASDVTVGDAVYGCALSVFWCTRVGTVAELLDGEVVSKHPLHNKELRGVLVRLAVQEPAAMGHPVLYLRHAPVGI